MIFGSRKEPKTYEISTEPSLIPKLTVIKFANWNWIYTKKNIWIYSIILNLYWVSINLYNYQQKHLDIGMLCCVLVKFWISFLICAKLIDKKYFMQQKSNSWMRLRCLFWNAAIFINKLTSLFLSWQGHFFLQHHRQRQISNDQYRFYSSIDRKKDMFDRDKNVSLLNFSFSNKYKRKISLNSIWFVASKLDQLSKMFSIQKCRINAWNFSFNWFR